MKSNFINRCKLLLKSWKALFIYAFGDKAKAKSEFEDCLKVDPKNGLNLRTLGKILISEGNYSEGLRKIVEALNYLRKDSNLIPEIYAYIAFCYSELNQLEESIDSYRKAIDSWSKDGDFKKVDLYYALGRLYMRKKEYEKAIDTFKKGLESRDKSALIHFGLGAAYHEVGDHGNGLQHLVAAIDLDPSLKDNETMKRLKKDLESKTVLQ